MQRIKMRQVILVASGLFLCMNWLGNASTVYELSEDEISKLVFETRNIQAAARFYWKKASRAEKRMLYAERDNNVDKYENHLKIMRLADREWNELAELYMERRNIIEELINVRRLNIDKFTKINQKSSLESVIDLTFGRLVRPFTEKN